MAGRIYLLNNKSELMPMHEAAYDSERLLQLRWLNRLPPFDTDDKRAELFCQIENLPGLVVTELARDGFPKISLSRLTDNSAWDQLTETLDWIVAEIRRVQPPM